MKEQEEKKRQKYALIWLEWLDPDESLIEKDTIHPIPEQANLVPLVLESWLA